MPVLSAFDVAAALRARLPGLTATAEHKLLYYCQGHHLAATGEPLFGETISAWDLGPVVGQLWKADKEGNRPTPRVITDEAALNTIGYVVHRYGGLRPQDLVRLTHSEPPWQAADTHRLQRTSVRIPLEVIRDYFAAEEESIAEEEPLPDSDVVSGWLKTVRSGPDPDAPEDTKDELFARARAVGG